jgi:hypothetical protein
MNFQLVITQEGSSFLAGASSPEAYKANGSTPLQAMRRWVHWVGAGVKKYRDGELTIEELADRIGISYLAAIELVEVEDLVPTTMSVSKDVGADWN